MNIAIVAPVSGSQRHHVLAAARELGREHQVTVYNGGSERRPRTRVAHGVTVDQLDMGDLREVGEYLRERWSRERPDIIHAHSWSAGLVSIAGAEGLDVPITQTFYRFDAGRLKVERALGRRADAVIAGSGDQEAVLIRMGVPRANIVVVPCGVDTCRFQRQGAAAPRDARHRLLHVGPLSPERGAHTAVRALPTLPGAELVLAGGPELGELEQDRDAAGLRSLARQLGVADRITFLGRVRPASVPKLMRSADCLITVPRQATSGVVAMEGMACGVPVIASAVGAHLDSVVDGVTGLLVPPDRPDLVAKQARRLLSDQTLRTALGYAGADRARSRYSWERVGQELLRVYESARA
ncbi:glycosyltransferase [Nonomuraea sediminis]|uniref:glycosyltransferase n=1 Tax=Nonomuraea sediminis TaxID=2835864 RepID=UPI001BDD6CD2|nr:glycosyltransferase [Nonomuraea sediminis]